MRFGWKIYSFLYCPLTLTGVGYSLWPNSKPSVYYHLLVSFNQAYWWQYVFYYLRVGLDLFGLVPLLLFVCQKKWLAKLFWKVFFWVKILSLCLGSFYEFKLVKSYFLDAPVLTSISALTSLLSLLPYYLAIYLYAFHLPAATRKQA